MSDENHVVSVIHWYEEVSCSVFPALLCMGYNETLLFALGLLHLARELFCLPAWFATLFTLRRLHRPLSGSKHLRISLCFHITGFRLSVFVCLAYMFDE